MYRMNPHAKYQREYLMICRKDTLGFIDFMRGKYPLNESHYVANMIQQMTMKERHDILQYDFTTLWCNLWGVEKPETKETIDKEEILPDSMFPRIGGGSSDPCIAIGFSCIAMKTYIISMTLLNIVNVHFIIL